MSGSRSRLTAHESDTHHLFHISLRIHHSQSCISAAKHISWNPAWLTGVKETGIAMLGIKNTTCSSRGGFHLSRWCHRSRIPACWRKYKRLISDWSPQTTEGEGEWLFDSDEWPVRECGPWGFRDTAESHTHDIMSLQWGKYLRLIGLTSVWCWTDASIFTYQGFGVY